MASASVITPVLPADGLIVAVEACMDGAGGLRVRARSVSAGSGAATCDDDNTELAHDLVAEYRVGRAS